MDRPFNPVEASAGLALRSAGDSERGEEGNHDDDTKDRAADRGARDDDAGEPVRARSARGRQAQRRVLGSLGARRQQAARTALPGMGREGKGRSYGRFHHLERRQGSADGRRRGAGQDRTRHHAVHGLVRAGPRGEPGAGRRRDGDADPAERPGQRRRRISRQAGWPLGRGADLVRQHALAALRPHRPDASSLSGST